MNFDSLKDQVSNLTLYDLKAGVRKVQNAVMNYTEMEAKVREATNNEPWGASSSLMQEIANGTYNYQLLNEIMPMIYKRFTEKSAEEWRQIYKALQLLEFLVKNGSERVIDDARSHLSLLKMLRQFHYIDMNGKDQGINVRNRAKELGELLSDVERIRSERKKARATRNKYTGVEGGAGLGFSSSNRYSGFGSESGGGFSGGGGYGGFSGGVYGDGGGFGGEADSSYHGSGNSRRDRFDEYDEYDEGAVAAPGRRQADQRAGVRRETSGGAASKKKEEPPKPKQPEVDLFSFDDPEPAPSTSNGKAPATSSAADDFGAMQSGGAADDDDFDDFQSATPAPVAAPVAAAPAPAAGGFGVLSPAPTGASAQATQFAAPQPRSGAQASNINDLFSSIHSPTGSISSARQTPASTNSGFAPPPQQQQPMGYTPNQPNYFTSVPAGGMTLSTQQTGGSLNKGSAPGVMSPTGSIGGGFGGAKKPAGGDAFSDLLSGMGSKKPAQTGPKVTMADLAKQKTSSGLWGAPWGAPAGGSPAPAPAQGQKTGSSGLDDLLG
ncbi:putative golgi to endosome transporter [Diplodia seriata]|uniref:Putative golgi to endosome transporter n=1 Tax=Diplodia seriata TaxID=420778 RepID=A0A0G2GRQ4_9PEZI|nr:putative golgi to endosome transporter [Diplodia seriata]